MEDGLRSISWQIRGGGRVRREAGYGTQILSPTGTAASGDVGGSEWGRGGWEGADGEMGKGGRGSRGKGKERRRRTRRMQSGDGRESGSHQPLACASTLSESSTLARSYLTRVGDSARCASVARRRSPPDASGALLDDFRAAPIDGLTARMSTPALGKPAARHSAAASFPTRAVTPFLTPIPRPGARPGPLLGRRLTKCARCGHTSRDRSN